jgi:hypothetical protein
MRQGPLRLAVVDGLTAGAIAALTSGAPSTLVALARGDDLLEPTLAAGSLLLPHEGRRGRLLVAAALVHTSLSLGWALVLSVVLPRRATIRWSVLAGLGIALLDLGLIGRQFERIRVLPTPPQLADHLAYAVTAGAVISTRRHEREHSETSRHRVSLR